MSDIVGELVNSALSFSNKTDVYKKVPDVRNDNACLLCSENIFITIGAAFLWSLCLCWVFSGLSIVADDFLMVALNKISGAFKLPKNVATAIFLSFGSAIPEIMTSVVSTLRGEVDASLPAILGSGCIAYALIPPICVLAIQPFAMSTADRENKEAAGTDIAKHYLVSGARLRRKSQVAREQRQSVTDAVLGRTRSASKSGIQSLKQNVAWNDFLPLRLATVPLIRDVVAYVIALFATIYFIQDARFELYESGVLVGLYILYVGILWQFSDVWGDDSDESEEQAPLLSSAGCNTMEQSSSFQIGSRQTASASFDAMDTNHDGSIDAAEWQAYKERAAKAAAAGGCEAAKDGGADGAWYAELNKGDLDAELNKGEDGAPDPRDDAGAAGDDAGAAGEQAAPGPDTAPGTGQAAEVQVDIQGQAAEVQVDIQGQAAEVQVDIQVDQKDGTGNEQSGTPDGSGPDGSGPDGGLDGSTSGFPEGSGTGAGTGGEVEAKADDAEVQYDAEGGEEEEGAGFCYLVFLYPFDVLFGYTIPDCGEDDWEDWYIVSFVISLAYIAGLASVTLWLVTQLCYTVGIPDSLAGVTLIALGAEVPDAVGSMMCAKAGQGPSAISNCLNSQIINLLVGLGVPYFIHSLVENTPMDLGDAGDTQMLIGSLLTALVLLFVWCTLGEAHRRKLANPDDNTAGVVKITMGSAIVLLVSYLAFVITVIVYAFAFE